MSDVRDPERDQQLPVTSPKSECVQDRMLEDMQGWVSLRLTSALTDAVEERKAYGINKYGQALMTHSGRDALKDAWEEAIDLWAYLTQMDMEGEYPASSSVKEVMLLSFGLTSLRLDRGDTL